MALNTETQTKTLSVMFNGLPFVELVGNNNVSGMNWLFQGLPYLPCFTSGTPPATISYGAMLLRLLM